MSILKWLVRDITLGDKIVVLFNNTLFNVST